MFWARLQNSSTPSLSQIKSRLFFGHGIVWYWKITESCLYSNYPFAPAQLSNRAVFHPSLRESSGCTFQAVCFSFLPALFSCSGRRIQRSTMLSRLSVSRGVAILDLLNP